MDERNPHHDGSAMVQASNEVSGPLYTSIVGLVIVVAIGMGSALAVMRAQGISHGTGNALILWVMTTVLVTGSLLYRTVGRPLVRIRTFQRLS